MKLWILAFYRPQIVKFYKSKHERSVSEQLIKKKKNNLLHFYNIHVSVKKVEGT